MAGYSSGSRRSLIVIGVVVVIGCAAAAVSSCGQKVEPLKSDSNGYFSDEDPWKRCDALDQAKNFDDVIPLLEDEHAAVRQKAVIALVRLDPEGTRAIPLLTAGIRDRKPYGSIVAASQLGLYGTRAQSALPYIRRMEEESDLPAARKQLLAIIKRIEG